MINKIFILASVIVCSIYGQGFAMECETEEKDLTTLSRSSFVNMQKDIKRLNSDSQQDHSTEIQKKPLIITLDNPVAKLDYDKLIDDNPNHPLVMASSEFLGVKNDNGHSDLDHNLSLFQKGLSSHFGSRVNNVIPSNAFDRLKKTFPHSCNNPSPMNRRIVNILNLYRLKTGERSGCYLGANIFDFSRDLSTGGEQKYIATEAPYDKLDYYRMVIDTDARVLVSLTTEIDDSEQGAFPKIRNGIKTNLHHLDNCERIEVDGYEIKVEEDFLKSFKSKKTVLVKKILISKGHETRTLNHIIYKQWPDGGSGNSSEEIADLILTMRQSERASASTSSNPIIVNCGYGYGRTGILILMHQISKMIPADLNQYDLSRITVNIEPLIIAVEAKIAEGSPVGLEGEKRALELKSLAEGLVAILVAN